MPRVIAEFTAASDGCSVGRSVCTFAVKTHQLISSTKHRQGLDVIGWSRNEEYTAPRGDA
jgi:hypothetical protein